MAAPAALPRRAPPSDEPSPTSQERLPRRLPRVRLASRPELCRRQDQPTDFLGSSSPTAQLDTFCASAFCRAAACCWAVTRSRARSRTRL